MKKRDNNKPDNNIFEHIDLLKTVVLSITLMFIFVYMLVVITHHTTFSFSVLLAVIIISFSVLYIINTYSTYIIGNRLNYNEHQKYALQTLNLRDKVGLNNVKLYDYVKVSEKMLKSDDYEVDEIKNKRVSEIIKRFNAEQLIINGQLDEAKEILSVVDNKSNDVRNVFLNNIAREDYSTAIEIIASTKCTYLVHTVITSFWKGYCLFKMSNYTEALAEFKYCITYGADTKYRFFSEKYVKEICAVVDTTIDGIQIEKKKYSIDRFYKHPQLWINLGIIVLVILCEIII